VDKFLPLSPLRRGKSLSNLGIGGWLGPETFWKFCGKEKSVAATSNGAKVCPMT